MSKQILTLSDLLEAAGGGQEDSYLEVYNEAWDLYRVEAVEPEMIEPNDLHSITQRADDNDGDAQPSLMIRLVLVQRNRPY